MKNIFAGLVCWLVSFCWLPAVHAQTVRVVHWNVHGDIGTTAAQSGAGAAAVARIVNYLQPDVFLMNEVADGAAAVNTSALTQWVSANLPYMATGTFYVAVSTESSDIQRNGAISRYPILTPSTYPDVSSGLRGMHSFQVQLVGTNRLQIYQVHLKCCGSDASDPTSCQTRQSEAQLFAGTMAAWAATNSAPYIFTGDCNESEDPRDTSLCTITGAYHPITTLLQNGGLVDYEPTNSFSGSWRTWSTGNPAPYTNIRFDYVLAATNRLSPSSGYVFSTMDWAAHGLYTNASPQNLAADSATASDHYCVVVTYSFPIVLPDLTVAPANAFTSSGNVGGPFSPSSQNYTLSNTGTGSLNWTANKTAPWLTLSSAGGSLVAGGTMTVSASINAAANSLAAGVYTDTIGFTNTSTGSGNTTQPVTLTVIDPNAGGFSDDMESGTNGWSATGLWHLANQNATACSFVTGHSGTRAWWYGLEGSCWYRTCNGCINSGNLISPPFIVPSGATLMFWSWEDVQPGAGTQFDQRTVSITTNAGASWVSLSQSTNDAATWYPVTNNLSAFAGQPARLRFRFDTVDGNFNRYPGWLVDDVQVVGGAVPDGIPDAWRLQFFGHVDPRASDLSRAGDDADGDGQGNLAEFLAGTDPTNSASFFGILSIVPEGSGLRVKWLTTTGRTNALQSSDNVTSNYADIFSVTNTVAGTTNHLDSGAGTNIPGHFYRLRLVP